MNNTVKNVLIGVMLVVIAALLFCLRNSINLPIQNQKKYDKRHDAIVERLKIIRSAQVAYKQINNKYTGSFDTLIDFVKNGQFKLVKAEGSLNDSLLKAGVSEREAVKMGIIKRDTIFISVKDSICKGLNPDSLRKVPFVGKDFELGATILSSGSGILIPVFEASVTNKVFMQGLDQQDRINRDNEAKQLERFPGLRVGSLTEANNNAGNWEK